MRAVDDDNNAHHLILKKPLNVTTKTTEIVVDNSKMQRQNPTLMLVKSFACQVIKISSRRVIKVTNHFMYSMKRKYGPLT